MVTLNYIEQYLVNLLDQPDSCIIKRIKDLVKSIREQKEKEQISQNISSILRTVEVYKNRYLALIDNFMVIEENGLYKKADKVQEILAILSILDTYLTDVTNTKDDDGVNHRNSIYTTMKQLHNKREYFHKEKIYWVSILKNLNIRIEDNVIHKKIKLHENRD